MEDQCWKDEYKKWKTLKPSQLRLLDNGANTLSQSWLLNEMWCDWNQLKKLKETDLPQLSTPIDNKYLDPWLDDI